MQLTERQAAFFRLIKSKHGDQKRKYEKNTWYYTHLLNVAESVSRAKNAHKVPLVEIALGHDVIEDTECTIAQLESHMTFLQYDLLTMRVIIIGIEKLTDEFTTEKYPTWNRAKRARYEAERLGKIDGDYQTVKYADIIDNVKRIVEFDPNFAKVYVPEKRACLEAMRAGDMDLFAEAVQVIQKAEKQLIEINN